MFCTGLFLFFSGVSQPESEPHVSAVGRQMSESTLAASSSYATTHPDDSTFVKEVFLPLPPSFCLPFLLTSIIITTYVLVSLYYFSVILLFSLFFFLFFPAFFLFFLFLYLFYSFFFFDLFASQDNDESFIDGDDLQPASPRKNTRPLSAKQSARDSTR
jgi:hypothetical protein